MGASKVVAVDRNQKNLDMCKELGCHASFLLDRKENADYNPDTKLGEFVSEITYGKGADVVFEMAGGNESVNNALSTARSGGEVVLFGLKDGDFTIPALKDIIVNGLTIHGVIGRQIFNTWQTSQRVLSDKTNGVQDKIWDVILNKGEGTVTNFGSYTPELLEKMMQDNPKIIIRM